MFLFSVALPSIFSPWPFIFLLPPAVFSLDLWLSLCMEPSLILWAVRCSVMAVCFVCVFCVCVFSQNGTDYACAIDLYVQMASNVH